MSSIVAELTRYYSEIQRRSNLGDLDFNSGTPHSAVGLAELGEGVLGKAMTADLFALAEDTKGSRKNRARVQGSAGQAPSPDPKAQPIEVIISLVTLRQGLHTTGLLLLPASLAPDGKLSADLESGEPWIPVSRMRARGTADREVMVGELASFWKWRNGAGQELASKVEEWKDVIDLSLALFAAVADSAFEAVAADDTTEVLTETCLVTPGEVITANGAILELYKHLAEGGIAHAPVYQRLLLGAPERPVSSDGIDLNATALRAGALRSKGSMSDEFPLTESQRRAVHAYHFDGPGMITAVSGPPGTGKTTMLQSVVASLIVEHALEGKSAPLIVGTSTNNQAVTNIIDSFSKVAKDEPGILDQRWLPQATENGAGSEPLRGLATYCPAQSKAQDAKKAGYLVENNRKGGVYTEYADPGYAAAATQYFLAKMAEYSPQARMPPPKDLKRAVTALRRALEKCEAMRRELIDRRAHADGQIGAGSAQLEAQQREVGQKLGRCQTWLGCWQQRWAELADGGQPINPAEEALVIDMNYQDDELAPKLEAVSEFVKFYENEAVSCGQQIDSLNQQIRQAQQAEQVASEAYRQSVGKPMFAVQTLGLLSREQTEKIAAASNLLQLDQALDTTVRYAQFWLAVHLYEAEWLLAATGDEIIPAEERNRTTLRYMEKYWPQVASLTPCFVMTAYQLPKYFKLWARTGEKPDFDLGRPDLLIVDEAGQVDVSVGAAAFALPKRALVVGDVQQLAPVWSIDPEGDREMASFFGLGQHWESMVDQGLTASDHSSIMAAASAASSWSYGPDADPGLFLAEHFRCHPHIIQYCNDLLYKGMLVPRRSIAKYKLKDKVDSPFLFREVANSVDQRKGSSRVNRQEAKEIADWISHNFAYFREIYNPSGDAKADKTIIGVVTPFAAQARLIQQTLDPEFRKKITVGTAHRLQGAERAVVLFSSVYGNTSGQAGFIDGTLELMNVAVSRAKDLFIVFGGERRWKDTGPVFKLVRKYATLSACDFASEETPADASAPAVREGAHQQTDEPGAFESRAAEPTVADPGVAEASIHVPDAGAAEVSAPAPEPDAGESFLVGRHAPGYLIARELIIAWREVGVLPADSRASASALNRALNDAGLIRRGEDGPTPTPRGAALGIALYEGKGKDGRYVNLIYSPYAQEQLAEMIRRGELGFT